MKNFFPTQSLMLSRSNIYLFILFIYLFIFQFSGFRLLKSQMEISSNCKPTKILTCYFNSVTSKCLFLAAIALFIRSLFIPPFSAFGVRNDVVFIHNRSLSHAANDSRTRNDKFLEVPQIIWGLNNQKIAFARSCLTARMLNRTLLMPRLSATLFYKEVDLLEPISFDKVFQFDRFNSICNGFVQLGKYSDVTNRSDVFELPKGSGRRWTKERDLKQLEEHKKDPIDKHEVIRIVGKHPFVWQDHWPVKDYAKVFECLVLVDEIMAEAYKVVSRIREVGAEESRKLEPAKASLNPHTPSYVAVHMRVEKDWMIHCKNLERKSNINQICSSKEEIMERVGNIVGLETPTLVYLAVADILLEDSSILSGWRDGLIPLEKKKLGVDGVYKKYPYLIQSAIDYEVCFRADVFVGNTFSTFSSLVVLGRTQKMLSLGFKSSYGEKDVRWPSYAYNLLGESNGPKRWFTNMSDSSLRAVSYGTNEISC